MSAPSTRPSAGAPLPSSPPFVRVCHPAIEPRSTHGTPIGAVARRWLASILCLGGLALAGVSAWAQTTALAQAGTPAVERPSPRLERIVVEDGGTRIDETRVGGVTRQIDVQPKGSTPAYQIQPTQVQGPATSASERTGQPGGAGRASWSLMRF